MKTIRKVSIGSVVALCIAAGAFFLLKDFQTTQQQPSVTFSISQAKAAHPQSEVLAGTGYSTAADSKAAV
jgi:hypothetical protein